MRRIEREDLAPEMADALRLLQEEVENLSEHEGFDPGEHWKRKRTSQPILAVYAVLKLMAGPRERCMYCVDSAGSDIEHFWPKGAHSDRMYIWENLLVACAPCGRFKGQQFPLALAQQAIYFGGNFRAGQIAASGSRFRPRLRVVIRAPRESRG